MKSVKATDVINKHGSAGALVLTLRRYAMLGWALFFLLALYHGAYVLVKASQPIPAFTFDADGNFLGTVDYVNPIHRTEHELLGDAKYFLTHYLSANAATVYDDAAIALSMMGDELRQLKLEQLKQTNQLRTIEETSVSSRVVFDRNGDYAPRIAWRRDDLAGVQMGGQVQIGEGHTNNFFLELKVRLVPRTVENAHGIEVIDIRDI